MGRKVTATMFGASILFPSLAGAFGLGEITLNSALNQPLNADISISKVGRLTESEIITKLASAVEFERAGVDRAYFLNDIKFEVVLDNKGGAIVQLTTRKSLVEPFLNFIVEVRWPEGKLLREYTLLLDPPVFSDEVYQRLTAASSSASSQAPSADESRDKPSPAATKASAGPVAGDTSTSMPETYGPVGPADSLWKIAEKVRPTKSVSIQQTMLALQRKNPDAFINNNINLLKQGKVLRVPDLSDIRSGNHQAAVENVRKQNKGWKNKVGAATVEKKGEAVAAQLGSEAARVPDKKVEGEARLKLVAATNDGDITTAVLGAPDGGSSAVQADVTGLQQSLLLKEESLDKALLKNEDLQSRLEEINEQIKTSEELITLKDDQISVLQKRLDELEARIQVQKKPSIEKSFPEKLFDNPLTLSAIIAAVVALLVGLIRFRRKPKPEEDELASSMSFTNELDEEQGDDSVEQLVEVDDEVTAEENDLTIEQSESGDSVQQELGDVIGEADIYIAYGRYTHAIELLKQGAEAEPERLDIRLKMLELLVETDDSHEFLLQEAMILASPDLTDDLVAKVAEMKLKLPLADINTGDGEADQASDIIDLASDTGEQFTEDDFAEGENESLSEEFDQDYGVNPQPAAEELNIDVEAVENSDEAPYDFEEPDNGEFEIENTDASEFEFEVPDIDSSDVLSSDAGSNDEGVELEENIEEDNDGSASFLDEFNSVEAVEPESELEFELELEPEPEQSEISVSGTDLNSGSDNDSDLGLELDLDLDLDLDLEEISDAEDQELDALIDEEDLAPNEMSLDDEDLDLLAGLDETATKLDLARAYLEMGDKSGAKDILDEVLLEGNGAQKSDAEELLKQIAP